MRRSLFLSAAEQAFLEKSPKISARVGNDKYGYASWSGIVPIPIDDAKGRTRQLAKIGDPECLELRGNRALLRIVGEGLDIRDKIAKQCVRTIVALGSALREASTPDTGKIPLRSESKLDLCGWFRHSACRTANTIR